MTDNPSNGVIRVERGNPDDQELAALVAVLTRGLDSGERQDTHAARRRTAPWAVDSPWGNSLGSRSWKRRTS
ncbi:acyl-CoA carboxylase subunit epsilon [Actinopolyspora mortivallis]|uniref:Acyl-CoA dehydrogenase n=1 Tax=Actinopolyspora mortivallis TaxID=33906 RepID=A0A2T0GYN5_ACTMO|nr:acyl-CoA carboxylase subunit epsilon [Actinopolyspora mortivallis]PRW64214.1 acyl-CoA dehydrogenase [Actinopolyspora mortivallis]